MEMFYDASWQLLFVFQSSLVQANAPTTEPRQPESN